MCCRCNKKFDYETRQWHISYQEFEDTLKMHHSSVARNLNKLVSVGLLQRKRKGLGKWNQYILLTPPSVVAAQNATSEKRECDSGGQQNATPDGAPGCDTKQRTKLEVGNCIATHKAKPPHPTRAEAVVLWSEVMVAMEKLIGFEDREIWLESVYPLRLSGKQLVVVAPNGYYSWWIQENYLHHINEFLIAHGNMRSKLTVLPAPTPPA
jgi:DNA-binding MarR family transcriptional regulator